MTHLDFGPWLETLLAAAFALAAFLLGRWFSRLPKPYWFIGYFLPLLVILLYSLTKYLPHLATVAPVSWLAMGRTRFIFFNFVAVMVLTTPLSRLPQRQTRLFVSVLIVVLSALSLIPFLAPAFNRAYLAGLKTRIDPDGVCRQSNDYTCGPAAAVTALRKLGLPAEEGQIAIWSHTSALTGTEPAVLAQALKRHYTLDGLSVTYRAFRDLDDLRKAGLAIVVMKFNALVDHCVTVLDLQTNQVLVGDPLKGLTTVPLKQFQDNWRSVGIVLSRESPTDRPQPRRSP